jgi:hypothetical protein
MNTQISTRTRGQIEGTCLSRTSALATNQELEDERPFRRSQREEAK